MISYLITGHGKFASGIISGIEIILGKQENYQVVDFVDGQTATELELNITNSINELGSGPILIFTDLLSGSPFNVSIMESMKRNNVEVIYGTNFVMLLDAFIKQSQEIEMPQLIDSLIHGGQSQIGFFDRNFVEDDDDF